MISTLSVFENMPSMFDELDAMFNRVFGQSRVKDKGLRCLIDRPHNLLTVKDKDGNVVGNRLEVVYTPFSKKDVKVEITNDVLTVMCGSENKKDEENESAVYHGISSQFCKFSFPVSKLVDVDKITATAEDGVLKIEFPFKEQTPEEPTKPKTIEVK